MNKREIAAIIALMIAGFVAYEVLTGIDGSDPNEVAPGETPQARSVPRATGVDDMIGLAPAARAGELVAVMRARYDVPDLPADAGLLAIAGNPGELFFTRRSPGRAEVCVMRATGPELLWSTETDRFLEIAGSRGAKLLLTYTDVPFQSPADAWQRGDFYALDMFAPEDGPHLLQLDDATVAAIRADIR